MNIGLTFNRRKETQLQMNDRVALQLLDVLMNYELFANIWIEGLKSSFHHSSNKASGTVHHDMTLGL